ncbi:MAG TPA: hypothetical protein VGQ83_25415 [Polyangia bacterium]|jgi:hypothetical protein
MNGPAPLPAWRLSAGVFLVALTTLALEILLIRVLDFVLSPRLGYLVITSAMFAFGLAGLYAALRPLRDGADPGRRVTLPLVLLGAWLVLLRPALNAIPDVLPALPGGLARGVGGGGLLCLALLLPFFLSGVCFAYLFSAFAPRIRSLYAVDLAGAAVGCVAFLPLMRRIGPGGLMLCGAALVLVAAALMARRARWTAAAVVAAAVLVAAPFASRGYLDFRPWQNKRQVSRAAKEQRVEHREWDPISRIDVVATGGPRGARHVAYDGGNQSTYFFPYDGDQARLRAEVLAGRPVAGSFLRRAVLVSHYLKRDSGAEVAVLGSAGGQEVKAALLFNARRVDGLELVSAVVRLGRERYGGLIGGVFADPRVTNVVGEGRSYLRATDRRYDVIQIYSNHTTSSLMMGNGVGTTELLQTVEAYRDYFGHLKEDGILHVNQNYYPRVVATAAAAWRRLGRADFARHVLVFERPGVDVNPTILIKLSPWRPAEVDEARTFLAMADGPSVPAPRLVVQPRAGAETALAPFFFTGELPDAVAAVFGHPCTDDSPYFSFFRAAADAPDAPGLPYHAMRVLTPKSMGQEWWAPTSRMSLVLLGLAALVFSLVIVIVPLGFSPAGRARWPGRSAAMAYFACLGFGFVLIELVLVQVFMKVVAYPVYAYSTVICSMLLAAGAGSAGARRLGIDPTSRWKAPFLGILITGAALWLGYPRLGELLLGWSTGGRIAGTAAAILPLGFFLGMAFPLGVLALARQPAGAIAWAWAMNGLFTVVGGIAATVLSIFIGFRLTLLAALGVYLLAFGLFALVRRAAARAGAGAADVPVTIVPAVASAAAGERDH